MSEQNVGGSMIREVDLLWKQGITPLREQVSDVKGDVKSLRESVKADFRDLASNMASVRRLVITIIVTSVPAYVSAIIAFFELKK